MFSIFKKKKKDGRLNSDRYFQLKIKEVKRETEDTNTLIFENPKKPLVYQPGQFVTLILPINGEEVRRSYSLCSSPYCDENPAITVKRVDKGVISNFLNDHMKVGDVFDVMVPMGHFVPNLDKNNSKRYVLFAAGSGITPIISIIKSILVEEPESQVHLVYQNRNEQSIIFRETLEELSDKYTPNFHLHHVLSQPDEAWNGYRGRIDTAITSDILMDIAGNKVATCEFFLCGPSGFMDTVMEVLYDFEVHDRRIHKESFYTGPAKTGQPTPALQSDVITGTLVTVILDGKEYEVNVPSNKSILEAALDQDLDMPFSCQSGLCTACRGKLLQGKVHMAEDEGLSEEEINQGYILNCVSRPDGPGVKVEIG
jgi:ring-1,2-phenylacetyl-CoA epoxidase subunit PaaE